jgi:hypothetical protein
MALTLVTYKQAKAHLNLEDDYAQADVEQKIATATARVLSHIGRLDNLWTVDTDPTADAEFAIVLGAILWYTGELWRFRGDDAEEKPETPEQSAYLRAGLRRLLHPLRRPSFA